MSDWTMNRNGSSNSSPEFKRLSREVERIIRGDAFNIINGRADMTARLIMAQLAHKQNVGPLPSPSEESGE